MKKSTVMVAMMVSILTMGTTYAQCCGAKLGENKKAASMQCTMMQKTMTLADIEKMMTNCPMMKGMSADEKKKMMANCPMIKFIKKGGDTEKLTKDQLQKIMKSCPMMKKSKGKCPMMRKLDDKVSGKAQTTCPVMKGNKINKSLYVDVEGKRIYVCCGGCIAKIKADPKKYIKELEAKGVKIEDTPKK